MSQENRIQSQLLRLQKIAKANGWIDIELSALNLSRRLEEVGFVDDIKTVKVLSEADVFGNTFPLLNKELEYRLGELKFKFEIEYYEHIPTLFIHSKLPISDELFSKLEKEIEDLDTSIVTLELINPYLLVETHGFCTNQLEHMSILYGLLHNLVYGEYENPPLDINYDDDSSNERGTFNPEIY